LKIDLLGEIIAFEASKQPKNPKFTSKLKEQTLSYKSNEFAFAKAQGRCQHRD